MRFLSLTGQHQSDVSDTGQSDVADTGQTDFIFFSFAYIGQHSVCRGALCKPHVTSGSLLQSALIFVIRYHTQKGPVHFSISKAPRQGTSLLITWLVDLHVVTRFAGIQRECSAEARTWHQTFMTRKVAWAAARSNATRGTSACCCCGWRSTSRERANWIRTALITLCNGWENCYRRRTRSRVNDGCRAA